MKLEKIFENKDFIIYQDNKGYDFAYDIECKDDKIITIKYWDEYNDENVLEINEWIGLFPSENNIINNIMNGNYEILEK